jgi:hypothetical protein
VDLKQIDKWLKHGVIKKSCSPWNFGLVAAPDNLVRLSRSTIFSGIDSIGAFHVIELEDKDKAKTAFATPW